MKLSIIVPVYNVEPYIRRCVDSILAQTFTEFEMILVDDGSPDNCPAICDEYARKDSRVKVIHKENGGLSDARNAGLDIAQGEYIGFVDSDDFIHPQMYEILIHYGEKTYADIVQCQFNYFSDNEMICKESVDDSQLKTIELSGSEVIADFNNKKYIVNSTVCNKMYRSTIFHSIRFPKGYYYEDSYIQLETLERSNRITIVEYALYYYFQRTGSIMHSDYSSKWFQGTYNNNNNNLAYFRRKGMGKQVHYALDELVTRFTKDKLAVYIFYPELKKEFRHLNRQFTSELPNVMGNPEICKMKKVMLLCSYISPKLAYRICKKLFPECLYEFMR